jgi:hypothetical protein
MDRLRQRKVTESADSQVNLVVLVVEMQIDAAD